MRSASRWATVDVGGRAVDVDGARGTGRQELEVDDADARSDVEDGQPVDRPTVAATEALEQPARRPVRPVPPVGAQVPLGRVGPELVADGAGAAGPAGIGAHGTTLPRHGHG